MLPLRSNSAPLESALPFASSVVVDLFEGDWTAVADFLGVAAKAIESDFLRIEDGAERRDARAVREAAHSLRGASSSIGSARVAELSAAIERSSSQGDAAVDTSTLTSLRDATRALLSAIGSFTLKHAVAR